MCSHHRRKQADGECTNRSNNNSKKKKKKATMFTPGVRSQYVLYSSLAWLVVVGAAYLSKAYQKLHSAVGRKEEKEKEVRRGCSIMQRIGNQGHRRTHSAATPPPPTPQFGSLKFDFIILRGRGCPARLFYIDAIKNVCFFFPFNVILILRRH